MREATIHLDSEALAAFGIEAFVSAVQTAGLEQVTELQCQRPGCLLVVDVAEPIPDARLAELDNLEWWEALDRDRGVAYLCKLAVPALDDGVAPHHETDVSQSELDPAGDGIDVTLVGRHDRLAERVREYGTAGTEPLLRTLTEYRGPSDPLEAVTPRQRAVLEAAYELGYFEVPKATTTDEIAAELDLDPSTVREHLQRAQRNLLTAVLKSA